MNVSNFLSNQLDSSIAIPYNRDYLGSIQLLENSGFTPYTDTSPMNSALYRIFNRFVEKTGINTDSNALKDNFLNENPSYRQAIDLYSTLENTFSSRGTGEKAAIVDFLNKKIDEFIIENDTDQSGSLTNEEAGLTKSLFQEIDANKSNEINAEEMQSNFYTNFSQLNNVLNYFQNSRGTLVDLFV